MRDDFRGLELVVARAASNLSADFAGPSLDTQQLCALGIRLVGGAITGAGSCRVTVQERDSTTDAWVNASEEHFYPTGVLRPDGDGNIVLNSASDISNGAHFVYSGNLRYCRLNLDFQGTLQIADCGVFYITRPEVDRER